MEARAGRGRLWRGLRFDLEVDGVFGSRDRATMARAFAFLYGAGALLTLLTLPLTHPPDFQPAGFVGAALTAAVVAALLGWRFDRTPPWVFPWLPSLGTVLASIVIYSAGADDMLVYSGFYFWVALTAFWFFSLRVSLVSLAWVAACYAAVLAMSPAGSDRPLRWAAVIGTVTVLSLLLAALREGIERLVGRVSRRLEKQERVAELGRYAVAGAEIVELFSLAAAAIAECLQVRGAWVLELDAGEEQLVVKADAATGADPVADAVFSRSDRSVQRLLSSDAASVADGTIGASIPGRSDPYGLVIAAGRDRPFTRSDAAFVEAIAHVLGDAIERKRSEDEARRWAMHDRLTQRPNRTLFRDRLAEALIRRHETGATVGVFVLDIDDFKRVNDAFGHTAGDEVLKSFGPRLREGLMLSDTVACFGGDEFAVLCEGLRGENEALLVADRIHQVLSAPFAIGGVPHRISASIGVALSGDQGPDDLIAEAEAAMYGAKERARGSVEFFDEGMRERLRRRLNFETALRDAPELGQLRLVTQPIVSLPDQRPVGSEALLRWRHPELGSVPPSEFIGVAEESGAIIAVGEWALKEAFRLAAVFRTDPRGRQLLPLHVNISMRQLAHPEFAAAAALRRTGASALDIALEITEHSLLLDESGTVDALSELRGMGFSIVLDDFGTGYSSLSHLKRLPLDRLKIDRMFITNLTRAAEDEAIVTSLIAMARAFDLDVIADGVETREQASRLAELGCWYAQGFLFSEPMSPWDLISGAMIGADQSISFRPTALSASRLDS